MSRSRDIFEEIVRLRAEGIPAAVATIVGTRGSTPGRTSMRLLVLGDGTFLGTVGGGAGFALGSLAALWLGPYLARLRVRVDWSLLPLAVAASLVVALLGAWLPARAASRVEPFSSMQEV